MRARQFHLGIYRMQVLNKSQTIMRWCASGGAQHYRRWAKENRGPSRGSVIGADPA